MNRPRALEGVRGVTDGYRLQKVRTSHVRAPDEGLPSALKRTIINVHYWRYKGRP